MTNYSKREAYWLNRLDIEQCSGCYGTPTKILQFRPQYPPSFYCEPCFHKSFFDKSQEYIESTTNSGNGLLYYDLVLELVIEPSLWIFKNRRIVHWNRR